jgi:two-component system chemotaxis sensor kinase CheA
MNMPLVLQLNAARDRIIKRPEPKDVSLSQPFGFFDDAETPSVSCAKSKSGSATSESLPRADAEPPEGLSAMRRGHLSLKVDATRIDSVLDLVGELVVLKSQLVNKTEPYVFDVSLAAVVSLLDKTVRELQDKALAIRMMPIKPLFLKMQRMAHDLGLKMGKDLTVEMEGEDTELDRMVVEQLGDPLLHLVRNAIDHGLESPEARRSSGKDATCSLRLMASQSGGRIIVRIVDDGRGIRRELVIRKALEKGLLKADTPPSSLTDQDVFALLLKPGFSTADKVTDISGRGVGLDVVNNQIKKLKGSLIIKSEEGRGSSFEISLPLTASVTDGMIVEIAGQLLIIPMDRIRELVTIDPRHLVGLEGDQRLLNVRGQLLPIICPRAFLTPDAQGTETPKLAVVMEHHERQYALEIHSVLGQMQVIMKPIPSTLPRDIIAGVTILGDGQVALVADVGGMVQSCHAADLLMSQERKIA